MLGQPETPIRAPYGLLASRALAGIKRQPKTHPNPFSGCPPQRQPETFAPPFTKHYNPPSHHLANTPSPRATNRLRFQRPRLSPFRQTARQRQRRAHLHPATRARPIPLHLGRARLRQKPHPASMGGASPAKLANCRIHRRRHHPAHRQRRASRFRRHRPNRKTQRCRASHPVLHLQPLSQQQTRASPALRRHPA